MLLKYQAISRKPSLNPPESISMAYSTLILDPVGCGDQGTAFARSHAPAMQKSSILPRIDAYHWHHWNGAVRNERILLKSNLNSQLTLSLLFNHFH